MTNWTDTEVDDLEDDAQAPWALGYDDAEPLERWDDNDGEGGAGETWLDEQLGRLRGAPPGTPDRTEALAGEAASESADGVALRRCAPRRTRTVRRADPAAAGDLPSPHTPGYVRDRRGTWRYAATGRAVPGARDLTLRWLHRFPTERSNVLVPVDQARTEAELAWCLAWKDRITTRIIDGHSVTVIAVPVGEWERRADIPIGLWAPELTAARLLSIGGAARLARVSPATITAYLSRGLMPAPQCRLGGSPVWAGPIIGQWLAARPGQGARRSSAQRRKPG